MQRHWGGESPQMPEVPGVPGVPAGREGEGGCGPGHAPSQLEAWGSGTPGRPHCRGGRALRNQVQGMAGSGVLLALGGRAELAQCPDPALVTRTGLAAVPAWCLLQVAGLCHAVPDPRWQLLRQGPCCS